MTARIVAAPEVLGLDEREAFRQEALGLLARLAAERGTLVIDLAATRSIDSAGLGVLLLLQRRAAEREVPVVLRDPSDEVRYLLTITRLAGLFTIEPSGPPPG